MKIKALCTSLFVIVVLVAGQVSFGMELTPNTKSIPELACAAPTIWEQSFNKIVVEAAAFDPENKNKVLLMLSEECRSYDIKSKDIANKEFTSDKSKADFIRQNSARPKLVGPYTLDYSDAYTGTNLTSLVMLGKMVTVCDAATKAPLYTIEHENGIKFAMFNSDQTKLITASCDNVVKISEIKKPIILEHCGASIAYNPDVLYTSPMIDKFIKRTNPDKLALVDLNLPLEKPTDFNLIVQLMALAHKKDTNQIYKLLGTLDFNSVCNLAITCDYLQIVNENINLTDILHTLILKKYNPATDLPYVNKLPFYMELAPALINHPQKICRKKFGKAEVEAATFDPDDKNRVLLMVSGECRSYDIKSENFTIKDLTTDKDKTDFIKQNSACPTRVGPYVLTYRNRHEMGSITIYDGKTKAPLYIIYHGNYIKLATFNSDQTQLITVCHDNDVIISTIKKPIMVEWNETSLACNPDIVCTSQTLESLIRLERQHKSVEPTIDFDETFDKKDETTFNLILQLMGLAHKMTIPFTTTDEINKLLNNLDINSLCTLAAASDHLQIVNEKINLTDVICECIAHKYDPKKDQPRVKELPPYCQNLIAKHRVEPCIKYIDHNKKPILSINVDSLILFIAFSSDGKTFVTGSFDGTAKIRDTKTGKWLKTLTRHTHWIAVTAFSHDGERVVTGSQDDTAKIWDTKTGHCLHTLTGHTDRVNSVAISSDGERVVTGSWDKTAKIWDVNTGNCLRTLNGHTHWITSVAISSDSKRAATGSIDHTAKIWDAETGDCLRTLSGHTNGILSVAFSPDGKMVVTGSWDKTAKIWGTDTGVCLLTLNGHTNGILSVAFSSDGKRVVTGSHDGTANIWDVATGDCLYTFSHASDISSVAFSPDGKIVATGSYNYTIKTWNIDDAAKQELLKNLTIEQEELLTEQVLPIIKTGKVFEPEADSKDHRILISFSPKAQQYLQDHVKIIAPNNEQTHTDLDRKDTEGLNRETVPTNNQPTAEKQNDVNLVTENIKKPDALADTAGSSELFKDKIFEPEADSKDDRILMPFPPKAQQYLQDHVEIIAPNNEQTNTDLDRKNTETNTQNPDNDEQPENNDDNEQNDEKEVNPDNTDKQNNENLIKQNTKKPDALADTAGLSELFKGSFFNKKWLWTGLSIGSFATVAATLFCYYNYFKRVANIF